MSTPTPPVNPFGTGRMTVPAMPPATPPVKSEAEVEAAQLEVQKQKLAALEQMLAASKRTAEPAQADVVAAVEKPAPAGVPGFYVKLKDCAEMFVSATEAGDRMDAIEVYKGRCGIISTIHPFEVKAGVAPAE